MGRFAIVVVVGFGVLFYRVAVYEHMTGWVWALASVGLSLAVMQIAPGFVPIVAIQLVLFGVLWRQHAKRQAEITAHRLEERERREAQRAELRQRGREEAERDRARREAQSPEDSALADDADSDYEGSS
jgi:fatty acid desaturase